MLATSTRVLDLSELEIILQKGTFLWVWKADKLPPHIGLSVNHEYYGLKWLKKEVALPISDLLGRVGRMNFPMVFIEVKNTGSLEDVRSIFEQYASCQQNDCSCLQPINTFFGYKQPKAVVHDLVQYLKSKGEIQNYYSTNLPKSFKGIPAYDYGLVEQELQILAK